MNRALAAWIPIALTLLSGCAANDRPVPSLLPRAVERRSDAETVPVATATTPDPELDRRLGDMSAKLDQATSDFAAAIAKAEPIVAAAEGASRGSDAWMSAEVAISEADAAATRTLSLGADLDRLLIERSRSGLPPYPALQSLSDRTARQLQGEHDAVAALAARIARP